MHHWESHSNKLARNTWSMLLPHPTARKPSKEEKSWAPRSLEKLEVERKLTGGEQNLGLHER